MHSLVQHFFSLIRAHSQLKRAASARLLSSDTRAARERCYKDFKRCAREVLDDQQKQPMPAFTEAAATTFFSEVYQSAPQRFSQPKWRPTPTTPDVEFDCSPFSQNEVASVIKKMAPGSAPSPFDRVGYVVFKKCPALPPALVQAIQCLLGPVRSPRVMEVCSHQADPKRVSSSGHHQSCQLQAHCLNTLYRQSVHYTPQESLVEVHGANRYLDPSLQKAFMPAVPGCTEHHLKLSLALADARSNHRSLEVCWLDLANAYGSVHHSLINFSLRHYHAPPQFLSVVQTLYDGLSARVITADWETSDIPLQKGVYQGDPLSVVIFNTVMNTLLDTMSLRVDLGYQFANSP